MTLDQYHTEWDKDAPINNSELDAEARRVPLLHAKWWRFYTTERLRYKKACFDYDQLYQLRWEYWAGKLDDETRIKKGWPAQPLKILSGNLDVYLNADSVLQDAAKIRIMLEETLRFLEDVIKSINGRGFAIKNAIDFLRFKMGV